MNSHVRVLGVLLSGVMLATTAPAFAGQPAQQLQKAQIERMEPQWFADSGRAASALLQLIENAELDGLNPEKYQVARLRRTVTRVMKGKGTSKAQLLLTKTFVIYASDVARARESTTFYADPAARPRPVSTERLLAVAARTPRFDHFISTMGWMHPYYGALREELRNELMHSPSSERVERLKLNLERARVLPRGPGAAIVVNTASARLEYFEARKIRDSMRVVVGQTAQQTPMMAGLIRYAILNPYWHVPPDLTRKNIAPRVLKEGLKYFRSRGYQVVSEWSRDAHVIPEASIDWKAVASGKKEVLVRQLPGPGNGMGEVKFMFPNELGIYLHDTPAKALFTKDERQFSAGCVRLEDAKRLERLLLGDLNLKANLRPEQVIPLPRPVPVYLTYMTMFPQGGRIVERPDVYGRDRAALGDPQLPPQVAG